MRTYPGFNAVVAMSVFLLGASSQSEYPTGVREAETARLRAHFDSVVVELTAADIAALGASRRAHRAELIETLVAYRDRGEFPRNYDFVNRAVPYFVDRKTGTLCAVAHLLEKTGRRDIVDRVARADNNVYVAALANDSSFIRWLDVQGISLEEAARIQVPYEAESPASRVVAATALVALTSSVAASAWNATKNRSGTRRTASTVGFVSGMAAVAVGAAAWNGDQIPREWAAGTLVAGALSTVIVFTLPASRATALEEKPKSERAAIVPLLPLDRSTGAGIAVRVRF